MKSTLPIEDQRMLEAYIVCFGGEETPQTLKQARLAFVGAFDCIQEFCEHVYGIDAETNPLPEVVYEAINWHSVWQRELCHEYVEENGFYFLM